MTLPRLCSFYFLFTVSNSSITTIPINIVYVHNLYIHPMRACPSGNTKLMVLEALGPMLLKSSIPIRDPYASTQYEELLVLFIFWFLFCITWEEFKREPIGEDHVADPTCLWLRRYYCCINSFLPCITLLKHIIHWLNLFWKSSIYKFIDWTYFPPNGLLVSSAFFSLTHSPFPVFGLLTKYQFNVEQWIIQIASSYTVQHFK